jgi:hypothetical protein
MPSRTIYFATAIAVVAGLIGLLIGTNLAPDDEAEVAEASGGVSNVGEVVSVSDLFDSFDRPDDGASLRALPRGPVWSVPAGTWGIVDNQAYLPGPIAGRNLAVVDPGVAEPTLQVEVPVVSDGTGLVFRYRDVANYWAFVAVPAYATWAVVKVVDGREQVMASTGLSDTADGTVLGIRLSGETIDLILDSRVVTTINDPELADATVIGLTARDSASRLDGLRVEQPPEDVDQPPEDVETDEGAASRPVPTGSSSAAGDSIRPG